MNRYVGTRRLYLGQRGRSPFFARLFGWLSHLDPIIVLCIVVLNGISILTLYGGLDAFGKSRLLMQTAMAVVGFCAMTVIANLDYRFVVNRYWHVFLIGSVALLLFTLIFGKDVGENRSWLVIFSFGDTEITVQPSEFIKITFICTFAKHLTLAGREINRPRVLIPVLLHAAVILGLILLSGDLGVTLVYGGIVLFMLFAAGLSLWYDVGLFSAVLAVFPFLWDHLAEYQQKRILVGFNPRLDPLDKGRQPLLSRDSIIKGGWLGDGLYGGDIYRIQAASHTDFMFGTVCEKFGFFGGMLVLLALGTMVVRILYLASQMHDDLGRLICVGVGAMLILQTVENIGMCLAILPVIGITLPFVSYGGSSVLAIYLLFGVLQSVLSHDSLGE